MSGNRFVISTGFLLLGQLIHTLSVAYSQPDTLPSWRLTESQSEQEAVVLDWVGSYWRYHLCLRSPEFSPPFTDAKGRIVQYLNYQRGWHIGYTSARLKVGEIPEGWAGRDYDDSNWVKTKGGFREGSSWYDQSVRVACMRGRFWVSNPAQVQKIRLSIKYIGGVAVYLNG
ncbi:MAG: hypothetical protein N2255_01780, partial [Kiritimatiellae bacterium]|nr:hypothetical protein [Kiritimatiellia bacterium]